MTSPPRLGGDSFAAHLRAERLAVRQAEVLRLLAGGATDRQIAEAPVISPATANSHVATLWKKLGANNRTRVARVARERALI